MTTPNNSGTGTGGQQGNPASGQGGGAPTPAQVFPRGSSGGGQQGQQQQGQQQQGDLTDDAAADVLGQLLGDNTGGQQGQQGSGQQGSAQQQAPDLSGLPDDVRAYVENLAGVTRNLKTRARTLEKERNQNSAAARRLAELEDQNKSETEKAIAAQQRAEAAAAEAKAETYRLLAAASHGISPDMIEFLGSGTQDEINGRAESLSEAIKTEAANLVRSMIDSGQLSQLDASGGGNGNGRFSSRRPVETLRPGGQPTSGGSQTAEQAFRGLLSGAARNRG